MFLAVASEVFATQFYGKMEEKIVKIKDASPDTFKVLLRSVIYYVMFLIDEICIGGVLCNCACTVFELIYDFL